MIPENGVKDPKTVNVRENIIAEAANSNLSAKKKIENEAIRLADANPRKTVRLISIPKYIGDSLRPFEVEHIITIDGVVVKRVTIPNR